jgi:hypothetical protein
MLILKNTLVLLNSDKSVLVSQFFRMIILL